MKNGTHVSTEHGTGVIIDKEICNRYCVKLDNCPGDLLYLQDKQGGLFFWGDEIELTQEEQ